MACATKLTLARPRHSIAPASTSFPLGPETQFEDAAAIPLAFLTAAIGLIRNLAIPVPEPSEDGGVPRIPAGEEKTAVLVYGAGGTVSGCWRQSRFGRRTDMSELCYIAGWSLRCSARQSELPPSVPLPRDH